MTAKFQFEKALADLEKIVTAMESGALTLDQALKQYEEGVQLVRACQARLTEAEKKIEVLTKTLDGSFKKSSFDQDEAIRPAKIRKNKNASSHDDRAEV
ncbi:MAG TPA: exodeoxyribonuclease VII small subunit [Candidatus Omnitrophota bacterium]|nr:exodeoxyribonuclease VII small subunit [Candidatus Omnitrophota bacterium]